MIPGRQRCLEVLVEHLAPTRLGRHFGLSRLHTLDDLRATIGIVDRDEHEREVEERLGFGVYDDDDPRIAELERGDVERAGAVAAWSSALGEHAPQRIALLLGRGFEPTIERILSADLAALGGEVRWIDRADRPEDVLRELAALDPDVLVVPSVLTCQWLESVFRNPLERRLPRLRHIFAAYDLDRSLRSRIPVASAGWLHRSGRMGLPAAPPPGRPSHAVTLAAGSQILELLAYTNPEEDARRVYAKAAILPEQAVVGQRYELVVTSPLGYLRMRTDEHVRVVGFEPPTAEAPWPRPRVVRLPPAPADVALEGCTVAGAWLTAAIRQSLLREDPALVAAEIGPDPRTMPKGAGAQQTGSMRLPDAFKETELAWMAKTGAHKVARERPRGLLVRIELQGYVGRDLPQRLVRRIDEGLRRTSPAYAYLRERDELRAPRVIVLPAGTRHSEEQRRVRELNGPARVSDVRVVGV
jgi:hypothetical protein